MSPLAWLLPLAAAEENVAEEGRRIIIGMLLVALTFLSVIALGQLARYLGHHRRARAGRRRAV